MSINIRKTVQEVPDNIPISKLDTSTADFDSSGNLKPDVVSAPEIVAGSIGLSELSEAAKKKAYASDENEQSVTGTTETEVKTLTMVKSASKNWQYLDIVSTLKTSNAAYAATAKIYVDAEGSPRATFSSTSTTYEVVESSSIDISDLANSSHTLRLKLVSANASETAYNEVLEIWLRD